VKTTNEYAQFLERAHLFEKTPKTVFAALAVSYALHQREDNFNAVVEELLDEWEILYQNGIVPQKPPKR
jgi:hypothetical protein